MRRGLARRGSSSSSLVQPLPSRQLQLLLTDWGGHFQVQLHGCWQETVIHHHVGPSRGLLATWLPPAVVNRDPKGVCTKA